MCVVLELDFYMRCSRLVRCQGWTDLCPLALHVGSRVLELIKNAIVHLFPPLPSFMEWKLALRLQHFEFSALFLSVSAASADRFFGRDLQLS